jgi:hypothetical protein
MADITDIALHCAAAAGAASPAVPQHRDQADVGRHVDGAVEVAAPARVFKTKNWV